MHAPRPYGLAVYGGELSPEDRTFIANAATKVTNFMQTSGIADAKYTRALPSGGFVTIQDMGGIFRAIAYKGQTYAEQVPLDGLAQSTIPMLFSGVAGEGVLYNGKGLELLTTSTTSRRISNYELVNGNLRLKLKRFRCKYDPQFYEFLPPDHDKFTDEQIMWTQYDKQRPTWYSGAMAEVVQVVGGYGRQDFENMPELQYERNSFKLPDSINKKVEDKLDKIRLPAYFGVAPSTGSFQFDFRFNKTHLVSFDSSNNPWLIQVDNIAVWAMPLPVIPATRTPEFREYIEDKSDDEILSILDRFGAMPSGEAFPRDSNTFYSFVRAGVIIKICDTTDFYNYSPYSSACGWSSNARGDEIVNTCFDYADQKDFIGYTYFIKLKLGVAENQGWIATVNIAGLSSGELNLLTSYLSGIFELVDKEFTNIAACIKYKIRRIEIGELLKLAKMKVTKADVVALDNIKLEPIAQHTGSMVMINSGALQTGVRIKLPDPASDGCISTPVRADDRDYKPLDTIVFAYYIGDQLKVIKNFYDNSPGFKEVDTDFEDIMVVGKWYKDESIGSLKIYGEFYSSDFDDREAIPATTIATTLEGKDLGYTQPFYEFDHQLSKLGTLWRVRMYSHETKMKSIRHGGFVVSFIVPFFCRNAAIYTKRQSFGEIVETEEMTRRLSRDPYSYRFWTYHIAYAVFGSLPYAKGKPYPVDGRPVWAEKMEYSPHDTSFFSDEGDWVGGLPADITNLTYGYSDMLFGNAGSYPPFEERKSEKVISAESLEYSMGISLLEKPKKLHSQEQPDYYYGSSPNKLTGFVVKEDACKVVFGAAEYGNTSVTMDVGGRYRWGYTKLADHKSAHHFIGVINE